MLFFAVALVTLAALAEAEFDPELHHKYQTMPRSSFIEYFNSQDYSWKMAKYDDLPVLVTCALIKNEADYELPLKTHDLEGIELPDNFDAREQWPQCESINEVYDQGPCATCWAFAATTTISDRICIHKDTHVRISVQDYDCWKGFVCEGGYTDEAFVVWNSTGLVSQECKPYNIRNLLLNTCEVQCANGVYYENDKHYANGVYMVFNEKDQIKAEISKNGPVAATFALFQDFVQYKSGIYEHSCGEFLGYNAVRVIGYGVENGTEYWLASSSWGTGWGEQGFFKIKAYQKLLRFENTVVSGLPLM